MTQTLSPPNTATTWESYQALSEEFQRQMLRAEVIPGLKLFLESHTRAQNAAAEEMRQFADARSDAKHRHLTEMAVQIFCDRTSGSTRLSALPDAYIKAVEIALEISNEVAKRASTISV
jgi:hypothetical protein